MEPEPLAAPFDAEAAHRLLALRDQLALLATDLGAAVAQLDPLAMRIAAARGARPAPGSPVADLGAIIRRYQRFDVDTGRFDRERSLRQYAALLGVSPATLSRYCAGQRPMSLGLVQTFLGLFPQAVDDIASALLAAASGADTGAA